MFTRTPLLRLCFVAFIVLLLSLPGCGGKEDGGPTAPPLGAGYEAEQAELTGSDPASPASPAGLDGETAYTLTGNVVPIIVGPQPIVEIPLKTMASLRPSALVELDRVVKPVSYDEEDLTKNASQYDGSLPARNVNGVGEYAIFSPVWDPDGSPASTDFAFCIYRFALQGYDDNPTVEVAWDDGNEPDSWSDLYIGFGNVGDDRWDWYAGPADGVLTVDSYAPYIAPSGDVLLAVALLGTTECALHYLRVGTFEIGGLGFIPPTEEPPDQPPIYGGGDIPAAVDLSEKAYYPPLSNQGGWGACAAFAVGNAAYTFELGKIYSGYGWDTTDAFNQVAPRYLYIESGFTQGYSCPKQGRHIGLMLRDMQFDFGAASELNAPFDDDPYDDNYNCMDDWTSETITDSGLLVIDGWATVGNHSDDDLTGMKAILAIDERPIIMGMNIDEEFRKYPRRKPGDPITVYDWVGPQLVNDDGSRAAHAMCIVGFDDALDAFKVRNSWHKDMWGDGGHIWISYDTFRNTDPSPLGPQTYCYRLWDSYDEDVADRFCSESADLAPPTGVSASQGSYADIVRVSWNLVAAATGYYVYRDSKAVPIATLGAVNSWDDDGLTDFYQHTYWVRAFNVTDESDFSTPALGWLSPSYTASGYVYEDDGMTPVPDVTMSFTGGLDPIQTSSSGYWERDGIVNGTYTVTPGKTGWTFDPTHRQFTIADSDVAVPDIAGTPPVEYYTASGFVYEEDGTTPVPSVTMSFTGGLASVSTNSSGYWDRDGISNGSYTVTPSKTDWVFTPSSRDFTVSDADVSVPDFTGIEEGDSGWVHTWGGSKDEAAAGIGVDSTGNVYIGGSTESYGVGNYDWLLLVYDQDGYLTTSKTWGHSSSLDYCHGIAVEAGGNAYLCGVVDRDEERAACLISMQSTGSVTWSIETHGGMNFGVVLHGSDLITGGNIGTPSSPDHPALVKTSVSGSSDWKREFSDGQRFTALSPSPSGSIYCIGRDGLNIYVIKYSSSGNLEWTQRWKKGTDTVTGNGCAVDGSGNVWVAGMWKEDSVGKELVLLKFSSSGTLVLERVWGGAKDDVGAAVAVDTNGNVHVVGHTNSYGEGQEDVLLLKFDTNGNLLSQQTWGAGGHQAGLAACIEGGFLYIGGYAADCIGSWNTISSGSSDPEGVVHSDFGTSSAIADLDESISCDQTTPIGVEDTGGGDQDVLVIKYGLE